MQHQHKNNPFKRIKTSPIQSAIQLYLKSISYVPIGEYPRSSNSIEKLNLICFAIGDRIDEYTNFFQNYISKSLAVIIGVLLLLSCIIIVYRVKIFRDENRHNHGDRSDDFSESSESDLESNDVLVNIRRCRNEEIRNIMVKSAIEKLFKDVLIQLKYAEYKASFLKN